MYIGSTNLFLNLPEYTTKDTPNWITSEKYYNCDFYYQMNTNQKKRKLFHKNRISKNIQ
jgi:hypothetical protein